MTSVTHLLDEFHGALGETVKPRDEVTAEDVVLRLTLIREEYVEVVDAFEHFFANDTLGTRADLAKELADLEYVIRGTARLFDFPQDAVMAEVHRSNMTKFIKGVHRREDGKLLKGPAFEEADIAGVIYERERGRERIATEAYLRPWYSMSPEERAEAEQNSLSMPRLS